jgi:hypothetical protein
MATLSQQDPVVLAISQATRTRLQQLLLKMYFRLPQAAKFVSDELLIDVNEIEIAPNPPNTEEQNPLNKCATPKAGSGPGKVENAPTTAQKRSRYAMCEQCDQEFDVSKNEEGDCQWHDGMLHRSHNQYICVAS